MRAAIIDIGTNTINLLVGETRSGGGYNIICSDKTTPRLGRGSFSGGALTADAMQRGLHALAQHEERIRALKCDRVVALGTSALRAASNAADFLTAVKQRFGWTVEVISGDREAQLIFDGVKQVMPIGRERILILDIGGGSCEFILANKDALLWRRSYDLGMVRILDHFTPGDPPAAKQLRRIEDFIRAGLVGNPPDDNDNAPKEMNLYEALRAYPTTTLVGTSGSFDTMAALVAERNHPMLDVRLATSYEIPLPCFEETYRRLIASTAAERRAMPHMDPERVDLIIPGIVFINFVVSELKMERLYQCGFALKQGAMLDLISR